ncbi:hypothetical protein [Paenibacillus eucommiae]|uniref:Uncharacterized protein n=1 Tax=Paenibacillus eucommiae TaxID=1355755 RepID=A0ABS4J4C5_9BACL|nr:hypothetical protein [Paenibacillus eucommiae]MBP1994663.1 hypothetical protein [Paenibacillus eucommiae]
MPFMRRGAFFADRLVKLNRIISNGKFHQNLFILDDLIAIKR